MSRSLRRLVEVFRVELAQNLRRPMVSVWVAVLILFAFAFSRGAAQIQAGDSQVGGQKAYITSQFAVAQQTAAIGLLVSGFFAAVLAGMSPVREHELRVGEVLNATSLRPWEYVWGKFLAALATFGLVVILQLLATMFFNHGMPGGAESAEIRGPFQAANYLKPILVFLLPMLLFVAGTSYAAGQTTRSPILVFVLPVALMLLCGFFLWDWSPSWLDQRVNRALMLVDPTGFRWLNETWLDVDRGVSFYNEASIPIDPAFAASRLGFGVVGLLAVAWSARSLARSLRAPTPSRLVEAGRAAMLTDIRPVTQPTSLPLPLGSLGMRSGRPGLLAGAWYVARVELRELRASPGLYLFIPLIVLQTIGVSLTSVGAFDTPLLATPGTLAVGQMSVLTVLVCALLLFYTVESVLRERHARLDSIAYATPLKSASLLLGKVVAGAAVGMAVLLAALLTDALVLAIQGRVPMEAGPFVLVWGLLLVPTFVVWCAFVSAILALTRNRYATYAIGLAVLVFSGYRFVRGEMNWLGNWPLWNSVEWSDLSLLEFDRRALILNRAWVLGLSLVATTLTALWFSRRERDAAGVMQRLRPGPLLRAGLKLLPAALPTAAVGIALFIAIERGTGGGVVEDKGKDYWRQNLATWVDAPLPTIDAVDIDLDLDPVDSSFRLRGSYTLSNRTDKPLRQIPVTAGFHWEDVVWTWDGKEASPDDRTSLFVFEPSPPLAPNATATLGFSYSARYPWGISKNGGGAGEFVLPSGVVLTSFGTAFAPVIGYIEGLGTDEENRYEARRYPDDFFESKLEPAFGTKAMMTTRIRVTAPAEFTVNSVGKLVSSEEAGGRRTVVWESDDPVRFFNVVAGRWDVKRSAGTAVFYHPAHSYNVEELSKALDAAREHYSEWFYPYPWEELKLSEFPGLATYAQGFPTNITFSESIGFLTDASDKADAAFLVAAHESAHQWWGNLLLPGKGPGGNVLSEGMAHFSTALLMEEEKGERGRMEFLKGIEDRYTSQRRADEERALVLTDGSLGTDSTVTYDRGGWVFRMLLDEIGREKMFEGLRAFISAHRNESEDFPVLQDLVAELRPFATDQERYERFVQQWIFGKALPEFRLTDPRRERDGEAWRARALVKNAGTGTVRVEVAAELGERFDEKGKANPAYRREIVTVELGAGEEQSVSIQCDFEPERVVVDPDVRVLQLLRKQARAEF